MKKTIPLGTLRTIPLISILRPWTIMIGQEPLLIFPMNIKKYHIFRDARGKYIRERFTVVSISKTEHYVVRWESHEKSLSGNLCTDSFGEYCFEDEKTAETVLSWHIAWEKNHDERYEKIATKIANLERIELKKIRHFSKYVPTWSLTSENR